jgi:3-hydroxy-9,10-secoandrosta-1,3,5(10)-triene-9,17-dione monooxygenase reductase component
MDHTGTAVGGGPAATAGVTPLSPEQLREVLGHLPTGVTVIASMADGRPVGMSANSFTSVSLAPPLVLFCPAKSSTTWPPIRAAGRFCVNVMAGHHEGICRQFARKGEDRFKGVAWHERSRGPALDDAVAWLDCEIDAEHDAGDHTIVVARVLGIDATPELGPLVFFRGRYGTFA